MGNPMIRLTPRQSPGSSTTSEDNSPSLSQLVSTLVPVLVVAVITVTIFLILRRVLRRNYAPRTFLGTLRPQERTPELPSGLFNWITEFNKISDTYVLNHQSIDGFLLLRYLKISAAVCFFGCLITWPVLFPVNATGGGGQKELNLLSFSNVVDKNRYYAHTFIAWIFSSFVMYMVTRESIYYINLRQAYLLSPLYASRMSSRTVLFTSVPDEYLDETKLRRMYGNRVKNIWIANDCEEMENAVEERDKVALKLEAAETKLIKTANAARLKATKKGKSDIQSEPVVADANGESGSMAARFVPTKERPTHRLKPIIGKKVDTINWCRSELERLIPKVEGLQAKHRAGEGKFIPSVFMEFYSQSDAQSAFQSLSHHQPLHMAHRFIGINPEEVIWKNLKITWSSRVFRNILTIAFVSALVIFWAIPVAFVGAVSNISALTSKLPWLSFINNCPSFLLGVIQGLLPSILLAVLMALLPIILRLMAKLGGCPSTPAVELRTQNFYFCFQVIQVFLVTTATSSAAASGAQIAQKPSSATTILARDLPKASNFYISYFILQGLSISSSAVLQIVGVILFLVLGKILDTTPRKIYRRWSSLSGLGWGTVFPVYTNLTVIAITYSIISPLVLGFATIGMYLIYLAYRYNLLFVFNCTIDTKGLIYRALYNRPPLGFVFFVFVILFHLTLNSAISPLLKYLPKSMEVEEQSLLALEDGNNHGALMVDEKDTHIAAEAPVARDGERSTGKNLPASPRKKPNFLNKWLAPHKYTDYQTLRRLVPRGFADIEYDPITERDAYYHPAISSQTPLLWIPRDRMGVSAQECKHSTKVIPMTDEGAHFDEKNKLVWDQDSGRPPIYQEKIYY